MQSLVALMMLFPLTLVVVSPAPVQAQSTDSKAVIWISARSVQNDGTPGGYARADHDFVVGKRSTAYLRVGDPSLCSRGVSSETPTTTLEALVTEHTHVWRVTTTPAKRENGTFFFDLEWARYSDASAARPVESGQQRLALVEGQRPLVLDLVRAAPTSGTCAVSVVLEAEMEIRDDATLADRLIQYDLWLVHSDASGRRETSHIVITSQHGAEVPFVFGALRRAAPAITRDQFAFDVTTRVSGSLRGRLRADGRIDVALDMTRSDRLERREGRRDVSRGGSGMGRKVLQLTTGQAIEIELPAPNGFHSELASAAGDVAVRRSTGATRAPGDSWPVSPGEPLSIVDGRLVVSFKPYFEGHKLSVLLQARAVQ